MSVTISDEILPPASARPSSARNSQSYFSIGSVSPSLKQRAWPGWIAFAFSTCSPAGCSPHYDIGDFEADLQTLHDLGRL